MTKFCRVSKMTRRIFETTLRAYQIRQPFKPFLVELVSGTILEVRHPEGLITQGGAAVYVEPDATITIFDAQGVARFSDRPSRRATA
jgi:hypothetical protein